ncbi:MAG TPA: hypothetical protein VKA70_04485 [Blastocatellia bacterium]|nr:hypothetical protein [Blastocatellia bacterium]
MRVKFLTMGMTLALAIALVTEYPAVTAISQDNTNQSNSNSPRRRRGRRPPPPPAAETAAPEATPAATETTAAQTPARRRRRGGARRMAGVPRGVQNCLDHLIEMASADPLIPYEGHPSEIVNNGLMWNDPKSKCSIGSDSALRLKVSNMATAWNEKDAAKVRSLLQEIKSAAPQ